MTYDRLFKEFASALARMDRRRGAELVDRKQADVNVFFDLCAEIKRHRDELRELAPVAAAKLDHQFDKALGDLTTRALKELGFGNYPTL